MRCQMPMRNITKNTNMGCANMGGSDKRFMIVVIGAHIGAAFAARLQERLGNDFAVVAQNTAPIEDEVFALRNLRDHSMPEIKDLYLTNDEPKAYAGKDVYALPNRDRQYLNKWQPR